jgi:hypothetical protein
MRQHPNPDDLDGEELDDEFGTPVYLGGALTVRELDAEKLQRFPDAHAGQCARLLSSGWTALDPPVAGAGHRSLPHTAIPRVSAAELRGCPA